MVAANPYIKYQQQAVYTMTSGELIILLYDKAAFQMRMAMKHIDNQNICEMHGCIKKAQDIVLYLRKILDRQYPISNDLFYCYSFIHKQLVRANIRKDKAILLELIQMMDEVKSAWEKVETVNRVKAVTYGRKSI